MPLYDFRCEQGHVTEALRPVFTTYNSCPECGRCAERIYSNPAVLGHREPDRRGLFRRFTEASAELSHQGVDPSSLWDGAKRRANAMIAAGENPVERSER